MQREISILLAMLISGCTALSHKPVNEKSAGSDVIDVEAAVDAGEYYRARKMVSRLLEDDPYNAEYQLLMAEVLEKEIAQQKEAFDTKVPEELDDEENATQAKTWLERAQELFRRSQYEESLSAAENVFNYDPTNVEASELIDQIHKKAQEEGKTQQIVMKRIHRDEMAIRSQRYREQLKTLIEKKQWSKAKLTAEKIMLLDPQDKEAVRLHEQIVKNSEAQAS
mgnify:CR=1 FL=1